MSDTLAKFTKVGNIAEKFVPRIFTGLEGFSNKSDGDYYWARECAGIEVKASDNNHLFRIPIEQLDRYQNEPSFLTTRYLYLLVCYKNKEKTKKKGVRRKTLLGTRTTRKDIRSIIIEQTDSIYVIDSRLIQAAADTLGTEIGHLIEKEAKAVAFGRKFLKRLCGPEAAKALKELGLKPAKWVVRSLGLNLAMKVDLFVPMKLTLFEIVPMDVLSILPLVHKKIRSGPVNTILNRT